MLIAAPSPSVSLLAKFCTAAALPQSTRRAILSHKLIACRSWLRRGFDTSRRAGELRDFLMPSFRGDLRRYSNSQWSCLRDASPRHPVEVACTCTMVCGSTQATKGTRCFLLEHARCQIVHAYSRYEIHPDSSLLARTTAVIPMTYNTTRSLDCLLPPLLLLRLYVLLLLLLRAAAALLDTTYESLSFRIVNTRSIGDANNHSSSSCCSCCSSRSRSRP